MLEKFIYQQLSGAVRNLFTGDNSSTENTISTSGKKKNSSSSGGKKNISQTDKGIGGTLYNVLFKGGENYENGLYSKCFIDYIFFCIVIFVLYKLLYK